MYDVSPRLFALPRGIVSRIVSKRSSRVLPFHLARNAGPVRSTASPFVAYSQLGTLIKSGSLDAKSITITTFALCGFANFSSIGIQIGGIGALAPDRRHDLARLGLRAMVAGTLANFMTATIAGFLL